MKLLLINIKELLQVRENPPSKVSGKEMNHLPTLKNAWLLIKDKKIEDFGSMDVPPKGKFTREIESRNLWIESTDSPTKKSPKKAVEF